MSEQQAGFTARLIKVEELTSLPDSIGRLVQDAQTPNPHALSAAAKPDAMAIVAHGPDGDLVGFWPVANARAVPGLTLLTAPRVPLYEIAGYPLVAQGKEAAVLAALVGAALQVRHVLMLRCMLAEGPLWDALQQMNTAGSLRLTVITHWQRALLDRSAAPGAEAYLATALSGSTRKRLRAKARALESEVGALQFNVHDTLHGVEQGFRDYLKLEADGWKGRAGTALAQRPADEAFVRGTLLAMAGANSAMVAELRCVDRVIATGLLLRAGGEVFFWKTTYDETLSKHSPGVLLDMMLTQWLYAQPWFTRLDTASDDSIDPSTLIWTERRAMAHILIEPPRGKWPFTGWQGGMVLAFDKLRQRAKTIVKRSRIQAK
jgi:CelD/BcsL family acetyltransferase involved in cellulose biosynthesis